jgi:hypothetical protein
VEHHCNHLRLPCRYSNYSAVSQVRLVPTLTPYENTERRYLVYASRCCLNHGNTASNYQSASVPQPRSFGYSYPSIPAATHYNASDLRWNDRSYNLGGLGPHSYTAPPSYPLNSFQSSNQPSSFARDQEAQWKRWDAECSANMVASYARIPP